MLWFMAQVIQVAINSTPNTEYDDFHLSNKCIHKN